MRICQGEGEDDDACGDESGFFPFFVQGKEDDAGGDEDDARAADVVGCDDGDDCEKDPRMTRRKHEEEKVFPPSCPWCPSWMNRCVRGEGGGSR